MEVFSNLKMDHKIIEDQDNVDIIEISEKRQDCLVESSTNQKSNLHNNDRREIKAQETAIQDTKSNNNNKTLLVDLDEDCTIIDDQPCSSNKQKRKIKKFPKSLKAKLAEYSKLNVNSNAEKSGHDITPKSNDIENGNEETIVIEDTEKDTDCDIELADAENKLNTRHSHCGEVTSFEEILQKEKVLADIIEICLDMENSTGMLRILNRTVIPIYKETSEDLKRSETFQRFLTKVHRKLQTEPNKKFTHLKEFCEFMKAGIDNTKRRVQLTTLKTNLNGQFSHGKIKRGNYISSVPKKKTKLDIINLDDDDDESLSNNNAVRSEEINIQNDKSDITTKDKNTKIEIALNCNERLMSEIDKFGQKNYDRIHKRVSSNHEKDSNQNEIQIIINDVRSETIEEPTTSDSNKDTINNLLTKKKGIAIKEESQNDRPIDHSGIESDVILIDDENDNSNKENTLQTNETARDDMTNTEKSHRDANIDRLIEIDLSNDIEETDGTTNVVNEKTEEPTLEAKINDLEERIKQVNTRIKELEETEVDWDNDNHDNSPYIVCEYYKSIVINLYKKLCRLIGAEAVKQRKVRLKVAEGHHPGPVRFLEEFINGKIDENGNPPFPDMHDVTNCVIAANLYHELGWGKREIENEARALFIHFGHTVQKKRQKREWRHLMRYVKEQVVDPAEKDPVLKARLEENAKLAQKNEEDMFAQFAEIDNHRTMTDDAGPSNAVENDHETMERFRIYSNLPNIAPKGVNAPNSVILPNNNIREDTQNVSNESRLNINSYQHCCNGQITDNIRIYVPPNVVVNQNVVPITYFPNTEGDAILNNASITNVNRQNIRNVREENSALYRENSHVNNENEMIEIEIDMKPNLEQLNATINQTKPSENNELSVEFEGNNKVSNNTLHKDRNIAVVTNENDYTGKVSKNFVRRIEENSNSKNQHYSYQKNTDEKPNNITNIETSHMMIQDNRVSTNSNTGADKLILITPIIYNKTNVDSTMSSCIEVLTHITREQEVNINKLYESNIAAEKSNTDSNENVEMTENVVVKKEPLDIPKMLAELGDNFTVSVMDIEDPFEIIDISDSSDSEDDDA